MTEMERKPIVKECEGCDNIEDGKCRIWASPAAKWRIGKCPSASHVKPEAQQTDQKVRVGQQKQRARTKGGKK